MDKFTRQLNLVALLEQSPRPLTFEQIRSRLRGDAYPQQESESARRAFERDKKDLLTIGLPLVTTEVPDDPSNSAYSISWERSSLGDPGFTPAELAALRFAATAMALRTDGVDGIADATDGLRKYGGLGGESSTRTVAEVRLDANLTALFEAILEARPMGFSYSGRIRRVVPRQLAHRTGNWYLRCDDLDAADRRTYRLDRIDGGVLPVAEEDLENHSNATGSEGLADAPLDALRFRPWEFGSGPAVPAVVRLDPPAAAVALAEDPDLEVLEDSGTVTTVRLAVRNPAGLWTWMLSFLDRAELLEPPELRSAYIAHLRALRATPAAPSR